MNEYLEMFIYFIASYISTFILYYIIFNKKSKKKNQEVEYMISKFKLSRDKMNIKRIKWILNIINPFIISFTFVFVMMINSFTLGLIVGFVMMMALIYSVYEIIGRILKRKEDKDGKY